MFASSTSTHTRKALLSAWFLCTTVLWSLVINTCSSCQQSVHPRMLDSRNKQVFSTDKLLDLLLLCCNSNSLEETFEMNALAPHLQQPIDARLWWKWSSPGNSGTTQVLWLLYFSNDGSRCSVLKLRRQFSWWHCLQGSWRFQTLELNMLMVKYWLASSAVLKLQLRKPQLWPRKR